MRGRPRLVGHPGLLATALLMAACSETPVDLGPFTIQPVLDNRPGSGCGSDSCGDYGMRCGAVLSIRIVDTEDGDRIVGDACEAVPAADTLCSITNLSRPTFFNIPPHRLRIEMAAWREEILLDDAMLAGDCPDEDIFDLRGVPRVTFTPQPAFAGAAYYDAGDGDDDVAEVPLSCTEPIQLAAAECIGTESTSIQVRVDDIETALDVTPEQADNLSVGAAEPRAVPDGGGGSVYVIDAADTIVLAREDGPVPRFAGDVSVDLGPIVCAVVLDGAPQSTSAIACTSVTTGEGPIDLRGALVANSTLDPILDALGEGSFPEDGLVVGRVLDHTGAPLAGVVVTPETGTVEYLSSDLTAVIGTETSSSGFFVSRDAPFGSGWTALHSGDGRREDGDPLAGLVRGKVTALLLRMEAP